MAILERSTTASSTAPPDQARYVLRWVVITSLAFLVTIGGGLWLVYDDVVLALTIGAFTAFWGGPGFGVMAGMALYQLRLERDEARCVE